MGIEIHLGIEDKGSRLCALEWESPLCSVTAKPEKFIKAANKILARYTVLSCSVKLITDQYPYFTCAVFVELFLPSAGLKKAVEKLIKELNDCWLKNDVAKDNRNGA